MAYHNHHPSASLDNAAYPQDSSYRPSAPTAHSDDKLAMPDARYSQSYNTGPSRPPAVAAASSWAPRPDPLYPPSSSPVVTRWSPDGMSAANPNLPPPPPYDPARPGTGSGTGVSTPREPVSPNPSESALLGQQSARPQSGTPQPAPAPVAAPIPGEERPRTYLQSMTGGMPAYGNSPGSLGPVAKARKKRKQKLGILAGVLCAVLVFLIALVVGILVGVVKVNVKDDRPPPPGPPRI